MTISCTEDGASQNKLSAHGWRLALLARFPVEPCNLQQTNPKVVPEPAPHRCRGSRSILAWPAWCAGGLQQGSDTKRAWSIQQCCTGVPTAMQAACKPSPAPLMVRVRAATKAVRLCSGSATTLCTGCGSEGRGILHLGTDLLQACLQLTSGVNWHVVATAKRQLYVHSCIASAAHAARRLVQPSALGLTRGWKGSSEGLNRLSSGRSILQVEQK